MLRLVAVLAAMKKSLLIPYQKEAQVDLAFSNSFGLDVEVGINVRYEKTTVIDGPVEQATSINDHRDDHVVNGSMVIHLDPPPTIVWRILI